MQNWKMTAVAAILGVGAMNTAQAQEQIRIVGSSTIYPFASYVVEEFGVTTGYPAPVIESTGTGGGFKLFCEGVGADTPDITNASRPIKVSELKRCRENGVKKITEALIGYDGIVFAQSTNNPEIDLTRKQLFLAVAAEVPQNGELVPNPYTNWNQIDSRLPDREISIYGPPSTSGTRDAFEELVMEAVSKDMEAYGGEGYTKVRRDGAYVPAGENDNLIVQRLKANTEAFGIFGYSFLAENTAIVQAASIEGVEPTPNAISEGRYPIARSLFFYVKNAHLGKLPGVEEYVALFMSPRMIGQRGLLTDLGLIPLPAEKLAQVRERVLSYEPLTMSDVKSSETAFRE
ncbi:MAG: PstS family phosphate ABC transporter substrate-binding protein [Nitrococcus sp.]|nr:PstS family phosphate ABC transporter substrate-binding protein [Nitrococcus sp.]